METVLLIAWLVFCLTGLVGWWRTFEKAGRPTWKCLIPVYNVQVVLDIAGRPGWWVILEVLPPINVFVALVMWIDFADVFGRGTLFAVGLWFPVTHPFFMLALGLGDAEYEGV